MAVALIAPLSANADVLQAADHLGTRVGSWFGGAFGAAKPAAPAAEQPSFVPPTPVLSEHGIAPLAVGEIHAPLPVVVRAELPAPSVETPLHRLFCVEYARMRSGLAVFGDARLWWDRARNLYARVSQPAEEAVMVFSGSKRLRRGHVAVVTDIVNPREIIVDQANWQNRGEIDHATPVLDVSAANDWSKVRVWDMRSGGFGAHVYAISGFISKGLTQEARND